MKFSSERYNPAWCPKKTFGRDGVLYRSGHEARCANAMFRLGIPYEYEPYSFPIPNLPGGYYTPDFIISDPCVEGGLQVAETSGWKTMKKEAAAKAFKSKADDPNDVHHVTSFVQIWTDSIDLHRDGKDYVAEIRTCDDCDAPGFFAPVSGDHSCPYCGSTHTTFVTKDPNAWDNEQYRKEWEQNWELTKAEIEADKAAFKAAAGVNRQNAQLISEIARDHPEWGLEKGDDAVRFTSKTEQNGIYVPEFVYYEPFNNRSTFGTAFDPMIFISCENKPTTQRRNTFDQILDCVRDSRNPLVKHAIFNEKGWFIADDFTDAHYKPGHLYECSNPECGKVYPAADGYSACPCCGENNTHVVK